MLKKVSVYTDGACSGNPGPGGWAAIIIYKGVKKVVSGGEKMTTNNRMELRAVIEALSSLKDRCDVDLYTDSLYIKNGITEWIEQWILRNWKTSKGDPVKNIDLWKDLHSLSIKHDVSWNWVKGHSGDRLNEEVDTLARDRVKKTP